jgi:hypothetical protein
MSNHIHVGGSAFVSFESNKLKVKVNTPWLYKKTGVFGETDGISYEKVKVEISTTEGKNKKIIYMPLNASGHCIFDALDLISANYNKNEEWFVTFTPIAKDNEYSAYATIGSFVIPKDD